MGLLEQMRDGYIGKCSTLRLLRYRAPIAHSCSPNESILVTVLGVRDNGVYHLDSGDKGERMGATRGWAMPFSTATRIVKEIGHIWPLAAPPSGVIAVLS